MFALDNKYKNFQMASTRMGRQMALELAIGEGDVDADTDADEVEICIEACGQYAPLSLFIYRKAITEKFPDIAAALFSPEFVKECMDVVKNINGILMGNGRPYQGVTYDCDDINKMMEPFLLNYSTQAALAASLNGRDTFNVIVEFMVCVQCLPTSLTHHMRALLDYDIEQSIAQGADYRPLITPETFRIIVDAVDDWALADIGRDVLNVLSFHDAGVRLGPRSRPDIDPENYNWETDVLGLKNGDGTIPEFPAKAELEYNSPFERFDQRMAQPCAVALKEQIVPEFLQICLQRNKAIFNGLRERHNTHDNLFVAAEKSDTRTIRQDVQQTPGLA